VVADVAGGDPDQRDLAVGVVAPLEEVAHGVGVVLARMGVGGLALEEVVPGELGTGSGGGDDRRRRPDVVVGPAASDGRPVVSRVQHDVGRITHFGLVNFTGNWERTTLEKKGRVTRCTGAWCHPALPRRRRYSSRASSSTLTMTGSAQCWF